MNHNKINFPENEKGNEDIEDIIEPEEDADDVEEDNYEGEDLE